MDHKEEEITFKPGIKPDFETKKELNAWEEKYNKLSREDKILLETQEQTRLLKRTSNNLAFFFWWFVVSIGLSVIYFTFLRH
jgi:hypothetical protein